MIWKDIGIALISSVLFAMTIVLTKFGINDFPPLFFAVLRCILLLPLILFVPRPKIPWGSLIVFCLCWSVIYLGGVNIALSTGLGAGISILMIQLSSFFAILFGKIFLKEKAKKNEMIGMFLGFIGLFFICSEKGLEGNFLGMIALLMASLFYAFGTIQSKKIKVSSFALIIWISALSIIPFLVGSILMDEPIIDSIVNAQNFSWGIALFTSWGSVLLASTSWLYLVKKYPISTISSFRLLIPVFGLFFSVLFLSEVYASQTWMGAGIIIIGSILTQLKFKNQLMEKIK